jgi:hypothetical protein
MAHADEERMFKRMDGISIVLPDDTESAAHACTEFRGMACIHA